MLRGTLFSAALLVSSATFAAKPPPPPPPSTPEVAYRLPDGKGTKLVVSAANGASQMTLYKSSGSFSFDLAPRGQRQIAIVDGATGVLKLLNYDVNSSGVYVPGTFDILEPSGVNSPLDFSPDGSKIAYSCCGNSGTRQLIVQDVVTHEKIVWAEGSHFFDISWFRGGTSIVYSTVLPLEVREVTAPMAEPDLLYSVSQGQTLDVESARTLARSNQLVISLNDSGTGRIALWEAGTGIINPDLANSNKSWRGTLDCTDTKLAFLGTQNASGSQAFYIRDLDTNLNTLVSKNSNILLQFWPTCS